MHKTFLYLKGGKMGGGGGVLVPLQLCKQFCSR